MKKQTKHILLLTPGFPANEQDDLCIPALQLFCLELNKREVQLTVVSIHYPFEKKSYHWNGIAVHAMGGGNRKGVRRLLTLTSTSKKIKQLHYDQPFDLIHSFWLGECAELGDKLSRQLGISNVCTLMGQDVLKANRYLKKLKNLPHLITLSRVHSKLLYENVGGKSTIIHWGIEESSQLPKRDKTIDLINVGWLNEIKEQHRFIRLIEELKKTFPEIKAKIVGEGELEKELKELVETLDLKANIVFTGSQSRINTLREIAKARVMVHTSSFESFGMVLVEALAQGTKVFSTPVGIATEIEGIEKYYSVDELVEKTKRFLEQEEETTSTIPCTVKATVDDYLLKVY